MSRVIIKEGRTSGKFPLSVNENAGPSRVESGIERKMIRLSAKLKLRDDRCVAIEVLALKVIKKLTTLANNA